MLAFGRCFCLMRCFCLFGEPGALSSPHQSARTSSCWTRLSEHLPYERYLLFTLFPSIFFTFSFNPCSGFSASLECKNFCHISRPFQIFRLPIVFLYVNQRCTKKNSLLRSSAISCPVSVLPVLHPPPTCHTGLKASRAVSICIVCV